MWYFHVSFHEISPIEGLNEVRPAVYQAALKLRALQKLCQMHLVALQDLCPVLNTLSRSGEPVISLAQEDVQQHLEELFQSISYKLPGEAVPEATDQTTRLLFKLFDREQTGVILLRSVEAALITLCGDTLSAKQRALFQLVESYSGYQESDRGSISRTALKILLEDVSQVHRYRCLKCLNVHLCQSCFLTERHSRKHKPSHPVLEYCTQPSWKESMASLASSARHALVPLHTRREAERKRALRAGSIAELQYSAPSPVLQCSSVADPDTHNAPETGLTATPPVVTVESKCLQTEETEIPQILSLRDRDQLRIDFHSHSNLQPEHDGSISENDWTQPGCLKPQDSSSGEEHVKEGREAYQVGRTEMDEETLYEVSEGVSTNLDDTEEDVHTVSEQQEEVEEEGLQVEQEELLHERQDKSLLNQSVSDLALEEHSDSDDSEMEEEEELCELVQRLRNELSLYTATGSVCLQKEKLMTAAEGVRDSVSHLVTSVRTTILA
ncbi:dystrotelin-like [Sinocyclocheilus grahami]|uniref:dystrotelin-like n=1 Tax=Sinocyclocheilus grahami TaxID=75366 RepID=UPI0007ACEC7D|nr:PREDICTED: dystrotelin-like [Sinocyclocheilus grahami]